MFKNLKNAWSVKEIRKKLLITIGLIVLFRLGCWLPIPGINTAVFNTQVSSQSFLSLLSGLSGGALQNGSLLALGVSPYISASIIVQLLTVAFPSLERASKMGEEGKKKVAKWTKWTALILAVAQAIGIVVAFNNQGAISTTLFGSITTSPFISCTFVILILVAGAMFTYWLGEKITEIGIANGLSMLIFVGILSTASLALLDSVVSAFNNNIDSLWQVIMFIIALCVIFFCITYMDIAERKIPVQYAKQIKGRKMYGGQSTYIPVKIMGTGVLPIIFAMSILSFPQLVMSIFWPTLASDSWWARNMGTGTWVYSIAVGLLILFFSYFYAQISFNPDEVSKQVQQNGGFIVGIRPGKPTSEYLSKISKRITLFGAIFLAFIAIVPTLLFTAVGGGNLVGAFSSTGMLIIVSVALEFDKQLEAQLLMKSYKGFLK